jgi:hypothetical protein
MVMDTVMGMAMVLAIQRMPVKRKVFGIRGQKNKEAFRYL